MLSEEIRGAKVKDYSDQNFTPDDEKDFEIRTIRDIKLIDSVPVFDDDHEFVRDMLDYSNLDDLPDSDRSAGCDTAGIDRKTCFDR